MTEKTQQEVVCFISCRSGSSKTSLILAIFSQPSPLLPSSSFFLNSQIVDAENVVVVVSRWWGGIMLGPDRFKHINSIARFVIYLFISLGGKKTQHTTISELD